MKIDATATKQNLSKHRSESTYYYFDYKRRSVTLNVVFVQSYIFIRKCNLTDVHILMDVFADIIKIIS